MRRPHAGYRVAAGLVLVALVAAAASCVSDRSAPTASAGGECRIPVSSPLIGATTAVVAIENFGFHPQTVRIQPGTTVVWVNCEPGGREAHTSTSDAELWESPFLAPGASFSHTFPEAGRFDYFCVPHPTMQGAVVVE